MQRNHTESPALKRQSKDVPASIMGPRLLVIVSAVALVVIGLVIVYSASSIEAISESQSSSYYAIRQIGFMIVGGILCVILVKFVPYHAWLGTLCWVVWALAVVLLLLTAAVGTVGLGAQRWLVIGGISLQPSEFAKIAFLLMSAKLIYEYRNQELSNKRLILGFGGFILLPLMLLYKTQSDLGTTVICFVGILAIMWIGEVPLRTILAILGVGIVFGIAASFIGYRASRWAFLNPWADYYGAGYQLIHSFYAFAQGGIFGTGLGNSAEKYLYLPEAETDFIFSIIGEEFGLIGSVLVIGLFLMMLYGGLRMAQTAPDNFGSMLCGSFVVIIVFQAFLNIGCVIGVLPTTGKPLPFLSSGGSSLIASLIMLGVILSVSYASDEPSVYRQRRDDLRLIKSDARSDRSASSRSVAHPSNSSRTARSEASSRNRSAVSSGRTSTARTRSASTRSGDAGRTASRSSARRPPAAGSGTARRGNGRAPRNRDMRGK